MLDSDPSTMPQPGPAVLTALRTRGVLWVAHIGHDDRVAVRAADEGFLAIGWHEMGDLSPHDTRAKMRAAMEQTYPAMKPKSVSSSYGQTFRFAHDMQVGDAVVLPVRPTGEIAVGRVSGPYRWSDDADLVERGYNHVRPVEWLRILPRTAFSQAALHSFGSFLTISRSDDHLEEVLAVLAGESSPLTTVPVTLGDDADESGEPDAARNLYETASQETEDYLLRTWLRTGHAFEHVVAAVFEAMGYTATVTQASGDHGVDVIAHPDPLGLERPYIKIQAKSGTSSIGGPEVSQLAGTLNPGEQGVLISLGKFTTQAEAAARGRADLTLIGPKRFVALFLQHYDRLAPEWRAQFPLRQVFVPFR